MVRADDERRMRRLGADLDESVVDDHGTTEERAERLEWINDGRRRIGLEPLDDRAPEEGFYDRARSLGMARTDR
jgi:hypothetical protein